MFKKLIPTFTCKSIFEVPFAFLIEKGYETLFIDLDNTLDSPYVYTPSENVIELIKNIKEMEFNIFIVSNNNKERVENYVTDLNVNYLYNVKKPFKKRINKFIKENKVDISKSIFLGDQIMTDVLLANRLKAHVILLNPLTVKDEPITFIPRLIDKHYRKKIFKKKLSKEL